MSSLPSRSKSPKSTAMLPKVSASAPRPVPEASPIPQRCRRAGCDRGNSPWRSVVGDEEVGPTIVVVITPSHAHPHVACGDCRPPSPTHPRRCRRRDCGTDNQFARHFVGGHLDHDEPVAGSVGVGRRQVVEIGVNVARYKQVEISISIVVSPSRTGASPRLRGLPWRLRPRICSRPDCGTARCGHSR